MFIREEDFLKNQDTRVQMTKRLLKDALLEILKTKPISAVTVRELCDGAGINRGTFYLHYATPLDLLRDIESDILDDNFVAFEDFMKDDYDRSYLSSLIGNLWSFRETFCILLGPNGDPSFLSSLKDRVRERTVSEWNTEFPEYKREHLDFLFDYVFPGFTSLMLSWFEKGTISAEEFTRRMERLGHYALLSVSEFR